MQLCMYFSNLAVIAEGEIILRHAETSLEISEATYEK